MLNWLIKASLQMSVIYFYNYFYNFINSNFCTIKKIMSEKFEQISLKPGFMQHNGGVMFRNISDTEYGLNLLLMKII